MKILLEVAITTLADARVAHRAGADRLELNAALELGGLTPSMGTLALICQNVPLPVIAMVRPRGGGFVYSDAEFLTMQRDADLLLEAGATGLAFGFLNSDQSVDMDRTRALVGQIGRSRQAVFHRAFDLTFDPLGALDSLIECGVTRILTSGQRATATAGVIMIRELIEHAKGRIEILPGSGVTGDNAAALIAQCGANQLHGSFSEILADPGEPVCCGDYRATSGRLVAAVRAAIG
jgi:copper homeostasis protein